MEELIKRENDIFDILQKLVDAGLNFIVVGGYAVSSFKHRFSVDADIVIPKDELKSFEETLIKQEFKKAYSKELEDVYSSAFVRYEKEGASIDIMIGALCSRNTDAAYSYELLFANSIKRKIIGIEKEVIARIPIKEILIATKIHSGRLTDFRDIASLAKDSDLEKIRKFLFIGNISIVNENLKKLNSVVNSKNFIDSFKGVFIEKKFDIDFKQVENISNLTK